MKLEVILYTQRSWCRPLQALLHSLEFMSLARVDLEEPLFLVFSIPFDRDIFPASSFRALNNEDRILMETSHLGLSVSWSLTLCVMSGCRFMFINLYIFFPSPLRMAPLLKYLYYCLWYLFVTEISFSWSFSLVLSSCSQILLKSFDQKETFPI